LHAPPPPPRGVSHAPCSSTSLCHRPDWQPRLAGDALIYGKNEQDDLSAEQLRAPLASAEESSGGDMAMHDELFADLMASVAEAGRIERGEAAPSRVFMRERERHWRRRSR
jgi:hypothetical protein